MPISSRRQSFANENSGCLRPYAFHSLDLTDAGTHAVGDCPFCGREGKFSVERSTGLWRCWVCGAGTSAAGGNALVFIRLLYEAAVAMPARRPLCGAVAADRRLSGSTPAAWGVAPGRAGEWLVPGYGTDGKLDQLYRRVRVQERGEWVWRLLPTPGLWPEGKVHALHLPVAGLDWGADRAEVYVCEGPWDGMALWEAIRSVSSDTSVQIVAVPGCNVWRDEWTQLCKGKRVTLMYDSDHPREYTPGRVSRPGYDGMARVARRLSGAATEVRWLRWGPDGYDPERASGWDVRDHLTDGTASKRDNLVDLFSKIEDAPREWFNLASSLINGHARNSGSVEAEDCSTWAECERAWQGAMQWRGELSNAMAVLLAVCSSTTQAGNQLFLDLIGSPGSAKTTMCRGLLVSGHCIHLENVTKILSGFKKPGEADKDCSFLARANSKTWVTCEFDTLATLPQYQELMGKIRRIFDGETTATYGNDDKDRIYTALRTPWIRAGTPRMMDHDQSSLGDRFLRYIINDPTQNEKRSITLAAIRSERAAMVIQANGMSSSILDPLTRRAYALTGGYVDWLRAHADELIPAMEAQGISESAEYFCADLADLAADLRARPTDEKKKVESYDVKELPTRLGRQNMRMACCLAVALNKPAVDADVLRIVRKVALDTSSGNTLNLVQWLCSPNPKAGYRSYQETGGLMDGILLTLTGMVPERQQRYMNFLRKIGVVEWRAVRQTQGAWVLTDHVYNLYRRVMRDLV